MEKYTNKIGAKVYKRITNSLRLFLTEIQNSELLLLMFHIGGDLIEKNKTESKETLKKIFEDPEDPISKKTVEAAMSEENDSIYNIKTYEQFYGQMCYARTIDNSLTYFKDILAEVILKNPKILKSKETEKLDFILSFDNIEDMIKAISEKKINSLFYKGISDIESFFDINLGINLFEDDDDRKEFSQAVKCRNLIVHNRGRISKSFIKEFPMEGITTDS